MPARSELLDESAEMISAWPMFFITTSDFFSPYFFRQACTAKSAVEFWVSVMVLPRKAAAGSLANSAAALALPTRPLAADSSLVRPMVLMPKRTCPSTAGTDPVPPTSHDPAADAAIWGTPAGKVENSGASP